MMSSNVNKYVDIATAASRLAITEQHVRRLCNSGGLAGARKEGKGWQIPVAADARLGGVTTAHELSDAAELAGVAVDKRDEAMRRAGLIREFEKFAGSWMQNGNTRGVAMEAFGKLHGIGKRSLERWIGRYRAAGIAGLVDTRGGRAWDDTISEEAWEYFKSMYLTGQQLSVKLCWDNINYINSEQKRGWTIPAIGSMYRLIDKRLPLGVKVLHREGMAAWEARCAPYIQNDPDSVEPGMVWIGDHHQCDCWVRHRGNWVRPWLTSWEDMRSRAQVGWHFSGGPNQVTILIAMRRGIEKYGPPQTAKIDNGKDYDSEMWTGTTKQKRRAIKAGYIDQPFVAGLYAMLDIGVSFAIKYHPQSKPVERFFDTFEGQFCKTLPTYCGKDTVRRPEDLFDYLKTDKAIGEAYSLEEFAKAAGEYIETVYNKQAHRGRGMEGRSPGEVMNTRTSRRVVREGVLDLLMRVWSGELVVGKNGVQFKGLWYGQYDSELLSKQGKKVRVAYDPDDLRTVHVYDAATMRLITIAEQNQLIAYGGPVGEENLREAMRQKSQARKVAKAYVDTRLTANMDITSLTIKAQQQRIIEDNRKRQESQAAQAVGLRPVITPLDGQVEHHDKLAMQRKARKAAGAEGLADLDMDLGSIRRQNKAWRDMEFFDD